jgi:alkaline phosphatase D
MARQFELDRRSFLAGVVATALAAACGREGDDRPSLPDDLPDELFALGVASGDPLPQAVILWTRIVADPLAPDGGVPSEPIPVGWEIATDEEFGDVVTSGETTADRALAHSVHVDATGLEPDTWYWYRFTVGDRTSPVGRTRTAPPEGAPVDSLRFAFASCQNREHGYWPAHDHLSQEDLDVVFFLGDYIYEYVDPASVRPNETPVPVDLATYRQRWGEYKVDPALQAAHVRFPWVCTWDDHEVEDNYADDVPAVPEEDGGLSREEFLERRAAAYQAYYEHLPLRVEPPDGSDFPIHRQLAWGSLASFFVLDTRQYRSDHPEEGMIDVGIQADIGWVGDEAFDESRTMLGDEQKAWLEDALTASDATWNVLAQQIVMARAPFTELEGREIFNLDQWDGYPVARRRVVEMLQQVSNPIVISGDIHLSAVGVLTEDPEDPTTAPVATEVAGTSISSNFPPEFLEIVEAAVDNLPHVYYLNARQRGYVVCEVSPGQMRVEFRTVGSVTEPEAEVETDAVWVIADGNPDPQPA